MSSDYILWYCVPNVPLGTLPPKFMKKPLILRRYALPAVLSCDLSHISDGVSVPDTTFEAPTPTLDTSGSGIPFVTILTPQPKVYVRATIMNTQAPTTSHTCQRLHLVEEVRGVRSLQVDLLRLKPLGKADPFHFALLPNE